MQWRTRRRGSRRQIGTRFPIKSGTGSTATPISSRFKMSYQPIHSSRFMQQRQIRLAEEARDKEDVENARIQFRLIKAEEEPEEEEQEFDDEEPNVEYKETEKRLTRKKSNLSELRGILGDAWRHLKEAASAVSDAMRGIGEKHEENESEVSQ